MKLRLIAKSLLIASLPLMAGCVEREVVYRPGPPPGAVVMDEAPPGPPPPAQVEVIPVAPDPTFMWIGGFWEWHGRWVWVRGHWGPRPHPGAVWVEGRWIRHGHRYVWVGGHWR